MPRSVERTPRGRETLLFATPEAAQEFSERARTRIEQQRQPGIIKTKEIIADEIAKEFAKDGEGVDSLKYPWEHTPEEHTEVQHLVNVAFEKDLQAALKQARASQHYPRNLDLLHDVLTTEMYQLMTQHGVNKQSTLVWGVAFAVLALVALFTIGIILIAVAG